MAEEEKRFKLWSIHKDCVSLLLNKICIDLFGTIVTKQCASFSGSPLEKYELNLRLYYINI